MGAHAAGLLVWRRRTGTVEVLLAHPGGPLYARKDAGVWTIPKGEVEPGEDPLTAARREFQEELGLPAPDGPTVGLGTAPAHAGRASGKVNEIWAVSGDLDVAVIEGGGFTMQWPPRSGRLQTFPEVDRAAWFDLAGEARTRVRAVQLTFLDRLTALLAGSEA